MRKMGGEMWSISQREVTHFRWIIGTIRAKVCIFGRQVEPSVCLTPPPSVVKSEALLVAVEEEGLGVAESAEDVGDVSLLLGGEHVFAPPIAIVSGTSTEVNPELSTEGDKVGRFDVHQKAGHPFGRPHDFLFSEHGAGLLFEHSGGDGEGELDVFRGEEGDAVAQTLFFVGAFVEKADGPCPGALIEGEFQNRIDLVTNVRIIFDFLMPPP